LAQPLSLFSLPSPSFLWPQQPIPTKPPAAQPTSPGPYPFTHPLLVVFPRERTRRGRAAFPHRGPPPPHQSSSTCSPPLSPLQTLAPSSPSCAATISSSPHPFSLLCELTEEKTPTAPHHAAMAPLLEAAPRRAEGTERCAPSSSSSSPKELDEESPNQRQIRRFRLQVRRGNLQFRRRR
jgi:hypothetical protein